MPKRMDRSKAVKELRKRPPEELQPFTMRLPVGMLVRIHDWSLSHQSIDLATSVRELLARGLASRKQGIADPSLIDKYRPQILHDLSAGRHPLWSFPRGTEIDNQVIHAILQEVDFKKLLAALENQYTGRRVDQLWAHSVSHAAPRIRELMQRLESLENELLARKKLLPACDEDAESKVLWIFSNTLVQKLASSEDDPGVRAVTKLIDLQHLWRFSPEGQGYTFLWDD